MTSLILVGCGKMGGAMLAGWLETGFVDEAIYVVEPNATVIAVSYTHLTLPTILLV